MQQFVVPQFIDVEDKVLGPITVRQFIILIAGGLIVFLEYKLSDFSLFLLEGFLTLSFTVIVGFLKINGRPIHYLLLNFLQTMRRAKLRVWDKTLSDKELKFHLERPVEQKTAITVPAKKIIGGSKLAELSLIVDTGGVYQGEDNLFKNR
ncbi:PrgI family protein [Candidatus Parcubacteria bacterium]|nr:MAG: PrgI family protein [Candidatus Parcubacteria bacterium]